jgi:hypothetical protein
MSVIKGIDKTGIFGSAEVQRILSELAPKHANNLMRSTTQAVASEIARDSRKLVPKRTGALRKGIKARRRKSPPFEPLSEITSDNFYWRYIEHGTRYVKGVGFVQKTMAKIRPQLPQMGERLFSKKLDAMVKRELKKQERR